MRDTEKQPKAAATGRQACPECGHAHGEKLARRLNLTICGEVLADYGMGDMTICDCGNPAHSAFV